MPPGPGGGHAHAEFAGVLGVTARGKGSRFLVPHLNELDLVLVRAQGLEKTVDAVAWEAEDVLHSPPDQSLDHQVGYRFRHRMSLLEKGTCFTVCPQQREGLPPVLPANHP